MNNIKNRFRKRNDYNSTKVKLKPKPNIHRNARCELVVCRQLNQSMDTQNK